MSLCQSCSVSSVVVDGRTVEINKYIEGNLSNDVFSTSVKMYLMDVGMEGILGMDVISRVGLRIGSCNGLIFSVCNKIVSDNADVFDQPLGKAKLSDVSPIEIIKLEESASPKRCNPRNLSQKDRDLVRPIIDGLLEQNVIVESRSSWRSNVVVVPKKDGTPRMTINYKELNSVTQFDAYPFPHVADLLSKLNSAKYTLS